MKYVIDRNGTVVIGSSDTFHADLARAFDRGSVVKSAGHCRIVNGKIEVYGSSAGYGIYAKPEDAEAIAREFDMSI